MPVVHIEYPVQWSQQVTVQSQHANLTETLESVMRGIAQAGRGEGTYIDASTLPTDDDDRRQADRRQN